MKRRFVLLLLLLSIPVGYIAVQSASRAIRPQSASKSAPTVPTVSSPQASLPASRQSGSPFCLAQPPTPVRTVIDFTLPPYTLEEITGSDGKPYTRIHLSGARHLARQSEPALPVFRTDLAIPASAPHTLSWKAGTTTYTQCPPPEPAPPPRLSYQPPQNAVPDADIYEGGAIYPDQLLAALPTYTLRNANGRGIAVTPFRYDFTRGVLEINESIHITLSADNATADDYGQLDTQRDFRTLQTTSFLNSTLLRGESTPASIGHLLVLVPEAWTEATDDFISWKRSIGFTVTAYPFQPSATSDTTDAELLTEYIQDQLTQQGVTHVIICGDTTDIPPARFSKSPEAPSIYEPTSDTPYVLLEGDDVPDAFISRIPAHSSEQLAAVLYKLINYESNPPQDDSWRSHAVFLASADSQYLAYKYANRPDKYWIAENCKALLDGKAYESAAELYAPGQLYNTLVAELNAGCPFFTYLGHGTSTKFVTGDYDTLDAAAMTNGQLLPFILAPVCNNGNMAYCKNDTYPDCMAEAFFLSENPKENGACATLMSSSETYWSPPIESIYAFTDTILQATGEKRLCSIGAYAWAAVQAGALLTQAEDYPTTTLPNKMTQAQYYTQQMQLTGDCTMMPRLLSLRQSDATALVQNDTLTITAFWKDTDAPIPYATLAIQTDTDENAVFLVADQQGQASLSLEDALCPLRVTIVDCSTPLTTIIIASPDSDGDGKVSTQELLNYLELFPPSETTAQQRENAIQQWQLNTAEGLNTLEEQNGDSQDSLEETRSTQEIAQAESPCLYLATVTTESQKRLLRDSGANILSGNATGILIAASPQCAQALADNGITLANAPADATRAATDNPLYLTPEEVNAELQALAEAYPEHCRLDYVGTTPKEREILALRLSKLDDDSNAHHLLVCGGIHGNERPSMMLALRWATYLAQENPDGLLDKAVFWVVPCSNPDGVAAVSRYTSSGADLNRHFPDGVLQELGTFRNADSMRINEKVVQGSTSTIRAKEARCFMRWCASRRFIAAIHLHTGDRLVCYPYGNYEGDKGNRLTPDDETFKLLAQTYADANSGISTVQNASDYYTAIGEFEDWQYRYLGTLAMTVELMGNYGIGKESSSPEHLDTLWEQNRPALLAWSACVLANTTPIPAITHQLPFSTDELRHIPGYPNKLSVNTNGAPAQKDCVLHAAIQTNQTITNLNKSPSMTRANDDGSFSFLYLDGIGSETTFDTTTIMDLNGDANVLLKLEWLDNSLTAKAIWLPAETRKLTKELPQGWSLHGTVVVPPYETFPDYAQLWLFDEGHFRCTTQWSTRLGGWLFLSEALTLATTGYQPDTTPRTTTRGWSIHTQATSGTDGIILEQQRYKRLDTLAPAQTHWKWQD